MEQLCGMDAVSALKQRSRLEELFANVPLVVGEEKAFDHPVEIGERVFHSLHVISKMKSSSGAVHVLLRAATGLHLGYLVKQEDLRLERAAMKIIDFLNGCFDKSGMGEFQAQTYRIEPIGGRAGLIEVVPNCQTVSKLVRTSTCLSAYLQYSPENMKQLARSTASFLAVCYILGVGDVHGDNIMIKEDGTLFRIDYAFLAGQKPWMDAPGLSIPQSVRKLLCDRGLWEEVGRDSENLVRSILGSVENRNIFHEMLIVAFEGFRIISSEFHACASRHIQSVSVEDFKRQWNIANGTKGTLKAGLKELCHDKLGYRHPSPSMMSGPHVISEDLVWFLGAFAFDHPIFAAHCTRILCSDPQLAPSASRCLDHIAACRPHYVRDLVTLMVMSQSADVWRDIAFGILAMPTDRLQEADLDQLAWVVVENKRKGSILDPAPAVKYVLSLMVVASANMKGILALQRRAGQANEINISTLRSDEGCLTNVVERVLYPSQRTRLRDHMQFVAKQADACVADFGRQAMRKIDPESLRRESLRRRSQIGRVMKSKLFRKIMLAIIPLLFLRRIRVRSLTRRVRV